MVIGTPEDNVETDSISSEEQIQFEIQQIPDHLRKFLFIGEKVTVFKWIILFAPFKSLKAVAPKNQAAPVLGAGHWVSEAGPETLPIF